MSVEEWKPANSDAVSIDPQQLQILIGLSKGGTLEQIEQTLNAEQITWLAQIIQTSRESWQAVATSLGSDELVCLMQALTIAEMRFPACACGPNSPVIYLNHELKRRGEALSRDQLQWFKANSSNRFIPNGPIL